MITKRIIPCLDVKNGRVVKGVNFLGLADVSSPVELASYYSSSGADELVFYDITASAEGRSLFTDILVEAASKIFIPLTILALFSIKLTPWTITAGLAFSALGDLAGSFKMGGGTQEFYAFVFQMLFFALAHIFYIITFFKLKPVRTRTLSTLATCALCAAIYVTALITVVP